MITQAVTVTAKDVQNIIIGRRGTYETEQIVFDVSYLANTYGNWYAVLMVKRPSDIVAYPAVTTADGNLVTWTISETDTSFKGHGEIEFFWYTSDGLAKSVIYGLTILRDIGEATTTPPDPYENWLDQMVELAADVHEEVGEAAQYADDAAKSAKDAEDAAQSVLSAILTVTDDGNGNITMSLGG